MLAVNVFAARSISAVRRSKQRCSHQLVERRRCARYVSATTSRMRDPAAVEEEERIVEVRVHLAGSVRVVVVRKERGVVVVFVLAVGKVGGWKCGSQKQRGARRDAAVWWSLDELSSVSATSSLSACEFCLAKSMEELLCLHKSLPVCT